MFYGKKRIFLPILMLEIISEKYNSEYEDKFLDYQTLGIPYYAIYNSLSRRRGRFKNRKRLEIYQLINLSQKTMSP